MARDPLVVVLLKVPFRIAVYIKDITSSFLGSVLNLLFSVLLVSFSIIHFRTSIISSFISGILKLLLISFFLFSILYPIYQGIIWTSLSGYPILLIPLILIEIISTVYLFKKSANSVPFQKRQELGRLIYTGLYDVWGLALTLLLVSSLIGITELNFTGQPDQYVSRVYKSLKFAIVNILVIPKLFILLVVPWRLLMYLKNFKYKKTGLVDILAEVFQGVYDIVALICLVVVALGLVKLKKLWNLYSGQNLTRFKVLQLFIMTFVDYFFIVLALVNVICLIRAYAMISDLYENGKLKPKKIIGAVIINTFIDTLTFPIRLSLYVFLLIGMYRLKKIKTSFLRAVNSSQGCRALYGECKTQALMQVKDCFYGFLLLLALPFLHRSIPALIKIYSVDDWHSLAKNTLFSALIDIPTIVFLIIIFGSLVRVPLFFKRWNLHQDHLIYLCLNVMRELIKDLFVSPYLLFNLLAPWRLYYLAPKLYKAMGPKEQRKILKADGILPIFDYLTIILTTILILSIWRTVEVLSIVVTHIRQLINNEPVNSTLLNKVFKKFLELIIDVFMVAMILFIFLLLVEVHNFIRRMRTFYYLYKDRRGLQYKKYLESIWPSKKTQEPINSPIKKLNRNIFTEISSFLDIKSLTTVAQVNRKFKDLSNFQPVWKFQYENQWKQHLDDSVLNKLAFEDDYKELVKKAYDAFTKKNLGIVLDEQERDYRVGARVIVLEEFILSIFGFPHIIVLPAKILCYLLSKVELDWYFERPRYPGLGYHIMIADTNIDRAMTSIINDLRPSGDTLKSFYHIQLNFVFYIIRISMILFEQLAFAFCFVDFFILKLFSIGYFLPFTTPGTIPRQANMSSWVYFLQLLIVILMIVVKIILCFLPAGLTALYTNCNWLWILLGPFCSFVPYYFAIFCNLSTVEYYYEKFYNFNPQFTWNVVCNIFYGATDLGKKLYRAIKPLCIKIAGFFRDILSCFKLLIPKGTLFNAYKDVLLVSGAHLKKLGYFGDMIFTPLTLAWIFWPLLVPYYLNEMYLLIPIFPIEIFLIIKGYSTAKLAWKED